MTEIKTEIKEEQLCKEQQLKTEARYKLDVYRNMYAHLYIYICVHVVLVYQYFKRNKVSKIHCSD